MFFNIHSHFAAGKDEIVIQNLYGNYHSMAPTGYFSLGIHPMHLTPDPAKQYDALLRWAGDARVWAVGECGLDRRATSEFALQSSVFSLQIRLANELRKPLIIHCVRAWEDIFRLLEKERFRLPVIFHGFNKTLDMAQRIVSMGYYLSFGQLLEKDRLQEVFRLIPKEFVFLETDAMPVPIASIYTLAAQTAGITLSSLCLQINANARNVFGEKCTSL